LRLLPISTGAYINNDIRIRLKLFKIFIAIIRELNKKYNIQPKIYLYKREEYEILRSFLATT
jgi:hypothetical protein